LKDEGAGSHEVFRIRKLFASTSLKATQVVETRDSYYGEAEVPRFQQETGEIKQFFIIRNIRLHGIYAILPQVQKCSIDFNFSQYFHLFPFFIQLDHLAPTAPNSVTHYEILLIT